MKAVGKEKSYQNRLAMVPKTVILLYLLLQLIKAENNADHQSKLPYQNAYGEGYGSKWILFPGEDGSLHFVSLDHDEPPDTRQLMDPDYKVQFRFYTRAYRNSYVLLDESAAPINETSVPFIAGAPVKMITHGWMSSADRNAVMNIKNEYLKAYDCNVVAIDWSETAESMVYPTVAIQVKAIGNLIGKFLDSFSRRFGVTGDQVHLVGHSLGAHIMGNAASACQMRIGRITGLDPARPMFEWPPIPDHYRLDKSDAQFVDVIHTCSAMLGAEAPCGHADFYPNSGYAPQPGCDGIQAMFEACSHGRAHFLFSESINNQRGFPAVRCGSWGDFSARRCELQQAYMGEGARPGQTGVFYLTTNGVPPFGRASEFK